MSRVYYKDLSSSELDNVRDNLIDKTLTLAYHNSDFVCDDCIETIEHNLNLISLLTKDDQTYEEIEQEIRCILKGNED